MSVQLLTGIASSLRSNCVQMNPGHEIIVPVTPDDRIPYRVKRINYDYISTSPAKWGGMHECDHRKVSGTVYASTLHNADAHVGVGGRIASDFSGSNSTFSWRVTNASEHPAGRVGNKTLPYVFLGESVYSVKVFDSNIYNILKECNVEELSAPVSKSIGSGSAIVVKAILVRTMPYGRKWVSLRVGISYWNRTYWDGVSQYADFQTYDAPEEFTSIAGSGFSSRVNELFALCMAKMPVVPSPPANFYSTTISLIAPECQDEELVSKRISDILWSYGSWKPSAVQWGDICQDAINNCRAVDTNTALWFQEILGFKKSLKQTIGLLTGDVSPKSISRLFLADKYGAKLTIQDSVELAGKIKSKIDNKSFDANYQISRAQRYDGAMRMNYEVIYADPDSALLRSIKAGLDWDLLPTLQNLWDRIPFSFVADWFVDIEGFCNTIDNSIYEQYLNVYQVIYSYKITETVKLDKPFSGTLNISEYHRHLQPELHSYFPDLSRSDNWKNNVNVLTALIVSRA